MDNIVSKPVIMIDARGRSCPEPVIMTKNALESSNGKEVEVLVDVMVAVENIRRFAENKGYQVILLEKEEDYCLRIGK